MKLAVAGAAGGSGRQVVQQALASGHEVTALVRDPATFDVRDAKLTVVRADVLDADSLRAAIVAGTDAVLSALGVRNARGPIVALSDGTRNLIAAMENAGVRRLVALSAAGMHGDDKDPFFLRYVVKPILQRALHGTYGDLARMEDVVKRSSVDWTVVLPTRLTNGGASPYRVAIDENVPWALQVSRANVASCMLRALREPGWIRRFVNVAD